MRKSFCDVCGMETARVGRMTLNDGRGAGLAVQDFYPGSDPDSFRALDLCNKHWDAVSTALRKDADDMRMQRGETVDL